MRNNRFGELAGNDEANDFAPRAGVKCGAADYDVFYSAGSGDPVD